MTALLLQLRALHPLGGGETALLSPFRLAETWVLEDHLATSDLTTRPSRPSPSRQVAGSVGSRLSPVVFHAMDVLAPGHFLEFLDLSDRKPLERLP